MILNISLSKIILVKKSNQNDDTRYANHSSDTFRASACTIGKCYYLCLRELFSQRLKLEYICLMFYRHSRKQIDDRPSVFYRVFPPTQFHDMFVGQKAFQRPRFARVLHWIDQLLPESSEIWSMLTSPMCCLSLKIISQSMINDRQISPICFPIFRFCFVHRL